MKLCDISSPRLHSIFLQFFMNATERLNDISSRTRSRFVNDVVFEWNVKKKKKGLVIQTEIIICTYITLTSQGSCLFHFSKKS